MRCCKKMTTAVPEDSRRAKVTYCPTHGRIYNPEAFEDEEAQQVEVVPGIAVNEPPKGILP